MSHVIGKCIGLPDAADDVSVRVSVERETDGMQRWTRNFDGSEFHTVMNRGIDNTFWERFGFFSFKLKLRVEDGKLIYPITNARFCGLPVPRFLLPSTAAFETINEHGHFVFDVRIMLPLGGLLAHYRGWLEPIPC